MTEKPTDRRLRRLIRLPSIGVALSGSIAALLAFAVWMFIDASFPVTLETVRIDLGLQQDPGIDMADRHAWDQLGSRLVLFAALAGLGALTTLLVFYRILFGNRHGRSLRSLFLGRGLDRRLWLTLGLSHEKLESAGFHWRLRRAVQGLKQDAEILLAKWPTTDGALPYSGAYTVASWWIFEDLIMLSLENVHNPGDVLSIAWPPGNLYPVLENISSITRTPDGGLVFYLCFDTMDLCFSKLEYHPKGTTPRNTSPLGPFVAHFVELEPNWFIVSYAPEPNPAPIELEQ